MPAILPSLDLMVDLYINHTRRYSTLSSMKALSTFRRGFGALYKPKSRDHRPAKRQALQHEIAEGVQHDSAGSDISVESQASFRSARRSGAGFTEPKIFTPDETARKVSDSNLVKPQSISQSDEILEGPASLPFADQGFEPGAEEVHPIAVDAQASRDANYVVFDIEEASDYTAGPARFIDATDGVTDCVAVLMTLELSQRIQRAVQSQREFGRAQEDNRDRRRALMQLEGQIKAKLASCQAHIAILQNEEEADEAAVRAVQQQYNVLTLLLDDVEKRQESARVHLRVQGDDLRKKYAVAIGILEEAFIAGNLIEPATVEEEASPTVLDLDTEYAAYCEQLKRAYDQDGEYTAPPLDLCDSPVKLRVLSDEEAAKQEIVERFWQAKDEFHQAYRQFENRELIRAREYQANTEAANHGEPTTDDSPEAFDIRWVKRNQELTRAVIDAEAAFTSAKAEMCEAGIELPPEDQTSVLYDRTDDGYRMSFEQELVASIPSPVVSKWMSAVPSDAAEELRSPAEVDEWDAEEVGISDSVSLVAEGSERKRIDRWRQLCGM